MDALKPAGSRCARRAEENGTWTVFDKFTRAPAEVGSRLTTGTEMRGADEMMAVLNFLHPANDRGTIQ